MHTPFSDHSSSMNEYNAVKVQLDKIFNKKIKGTILRSKGRWYENRAKNTNQHLEKRNFLRKKISKLKLSNGEETKDPKEILEEEKYFYKNLFQSEARSPTGMPFVRYAFCFRYRNTSTCNI